ncbi:MAG TPA: transcriptional regulator [Planctomycetaceae bacterium]|nr:transcriptional regulator [Planctomycetaceae bacterium]
MPESLKQADREFLQSLMGLESATIAQLCDSQGVTTNAIRIRLTGLMSAGLVERTTIRQGRGRPQHEYRVTNKGKREFGDNYSELATVLWQQISHIEDEAVRSQIAAELKKTLINRYGRDIDGIDLSERIQQLQQVLQDYGYQCEVDQQANKVSLTEKCCPYHDLAVEDRSICELEQTVFEQILGVPLELTQRCVDGHSCCRFEHVELTVDSSK